MNSKVRFVIYCILFVVLIFSSVKIYDTLKENIDNTQLSDNNNHRVSSGEDNTLLEDNQNDKSIAPNFKVLNYDGEEVQLSDFRGEKIVLNFWATWCPQCKEELPYFNDAYKKYGDRIEFLMVNLTDKKEKSVDGVKSFVSDNQYDFSPYFDTGSEAANAYQIFYIPETYFIDENGYILNSQTGPISKEKLEENINQMIGIDEKYIKAINEFIDSCKESKEYTINLDSELFGDEISDYVNILQVEEVSATVHSDGKNFVSIRPIPTGLDNKNYYFKDDELVAYSREFLGIGGSVTYYFKNGELFAVDKTKIEEEMNFQNEDFNKIIEHSNVAKERYLNK